MAFVVVAALVSVSVRCSCVRTSSVVGSVVTKRREEKKSKQANKPTNGDKNDDFVLRLLLLLSEVQAAGGQHIRAQPGRAARQDRGGQAAVLRQDPSGEVVQDRRLPLSESEVGPQRHLQEPQLREEHRHCGRQDTARDHAAGSQLLRRQLSQDRQEATRAAANGHNNNYRARQWHCNNDEQQQRSGGSTAADSRRRRRPNERGEQRVLGVSEDGGEPVPEVLRQGGGQPVHDELLAQLRHVRVPIQRHVLQQQPGRGGARRAALERPPVLGHHGQAPRTRRQPARRLLVGQHGQDRARSPLHHARELPQQQQQQQWQQQRARLRRGRGRRRPRALHVRRVLRPHHAPSQHSNSSDRAFRSSSSSSWRHQRRHGAHQHGQRAARAQERLGRVQATAAAAAATGSQEVLEQHCAPDVLQAVAQQQQRRVESVVNRRDGRNARRLGNDTSGHRCAATATATAATAIATGQRRSGPRGEDVAEDAGVQGRLHDHQQDRAAHTRLPGRQQAVRLGVHALRALRLPHTHVQREAAARHSHQGAHQAPRLASQLVGAAQVPDHQGDQLVHSDSRHALGRHHRPDHRDIHQSAQASQLQRRASHGSQRLNGIVVLRRRSCD